jgi:hypothetical protein
VGVISTMNKSWLIGLLLLLLGLSIGVLFTAAHYELETVEGNLKSADGNTGVLEYYAQDGIGNEFCYEVYSSMGGLFEIDAIINAKPILDWLRPNLRKEARQAKMRMQNVISEYTEKFECGLPFILEKSDLRSLGYDL